MNPQHIEFIKYFPVNITTLAELPPEIKSITKYCLTYAKVKSWLIIVLFISVILHIYFRRNYKDWMLKDGRVFLYREQMERALFFFQIVSLFYIFYLQLLE